MTGDKLGSLGSVVAVDTGIGAKQPSTLGKLFGRKPTPGIVIFVCCQDCAAKVKSDPGTYLVRVIAEHGGSPMTSAAVSPADRTTRK